MVGLAGEVEFVAVRQVSAVREVEAHDGVARLEHGRVRRLIGLRAGMRLYVDVLGAEKLFRAVAGQVLHFVGDIRSRRNSACRDSLRRTCW